MPRSLRESSFRGNGLLSEEVEPANSLANMADCMLVLALGFLVALVSFWNIELSPYEEIKEDQLYEIDAEALSEEAIVNGSNYIEAGVVYQDATTGELYLLESDEADIEGSAEISSSGLAGINTAQSGASSGGSSSNSSTATDTSAGSDSAASSGSSSEGSMLSNEEIAASRSLGAD